MRNPFYYLASRSEATLAGLHPVTGASVAFALYLGQFKRRQDKLIVAVPAVFSPQARSALLRSLKLLNISSAQLLDTNAAVATLYAVERLRKGENATQRVLFADIGAAQCELSLWAFERAGMVTRATLLDYRYSDEIGGDAVDRRIVEAVTAGLARAPTRPEAAAIARMVRRAKEQLAAGGEHAVDLSEDFQTRVPLSNARVAELAAAETAKLARLVE